MAVRPITIPIDAGVENILNFWWKYRGKPITLTGYTVEFKVKKKITDTEYLFILTDTDDISVTAADGLMRVSISAENSALLASVAEERNPFELQAAPAGEDPRCVAKGNLLGKPGV